MNSKRDSIPSKSDNSDESSETTNDMPFRLMDLPHELRNLIRHFDILGSSNGDYINVERQGPTRVVHLTQVCRQLRTETIGPYYSNLPFRIESISAATVFAFFEATGEIGQTYIRGLLCYWDFPDPIRILPLFQRLPALSRLEIDLGHPSCGKLIRLARALSKDWAVILQQESCFQQLGRLRGIQSFQLFVHPLQRSSSKCGRRPCRCSVLRFYEARKAEVQDLSDHIDRQIKQPRPH